MKRNRLAGLGIGFLLLATSAFAAPPIADSTSISPASALGTSSCTAWTASNFKFYHPPTESSSYYVDANDGQCYEKTSCVNGLNAAGTTCKPVVVANPPAVVERRVAPATPAAIHGYGSPATITFSIAPSAVIGSMAPTNWQAGGNPMPTRVTVGCYSAATGKLRAWWGYPYSNGPSEVAATAEMIGDNWCYAFTENNNGKAQSTPQPLTVGCGDDMAFDAASGTCKPIVPPLFDCPAFLRPANGVGPVTPLKEANPTVLTPDGHEWCYYYGFGGNDGGDPWAAAFDRVVGKPVAYYPHYVERVLNLYGHQYLGFDSTSFQGLIPVYGSGNKLDNVTLDGGAKCALPLSYKMEAYWDAWYPSDCGGGPHGLQFYGPTGNRYPGAALCIYDLHPSNPFLTERGYKQVKIGGLRDMGGASFRSANGLIYSIAPRVAYPAQLMGCKPGMVSLGTFDPNAPVIDYRRGR